MPRFVRKGDRLTQLAQDNVGQVLDQVSQQLSGANAGILGGAVLTLTAQGSSQSFTLSHGLGYTPKNLIPLISRSAAVGWLLSAPMDASSVYLKSSAALSAGQTYSFLVW